MFTWHNYSALAVHFLQPMACQIEFCVSTVAFSVCNTSAAMATTYHPKLDLRYLLPAEVRLLYYYGGNKYSCLWEYYTTCVITVYTINNIIVAGGRKALLYISA